MRGWLSTLAHQIIGLQKSKKFFNRKFDHFLYEAGGRIFYVKNTLRHVTISYIFYGTVTNNNDLFKLHLYKSFL